MEFLSFKFHIPHSQSSETVLFSGSCTHCRYTTGVCAPPVHNCVCVYMPPVHNRCAHAAGTQLVCVHATSTQLCVHAASTEPVCVHADGTQPVCACRQYTTGVCARRRYTIGVCMPPVESQVPPLHLFPVSHRLVTRQPDTDRGRIGGVRN